MPQSYGSRNESTTYWKSVILKVLGSSVDKAAYSATSIRDISNTNNQGSRRKGGRRRNDVRNHFPARGGDACGMPIFNSYRKYAPRDTVLEGLENSAREAKKGLWAYPHPVPPWESGEKEAGEPPDA